MALLAPRYAPRMLSGASRAIRPCDGGTQSISPSTKSRSIRISSGSAVLTETSRNGVPIAAMPTAIRMNSLTLPRAP